MLEFVICEDNKIINNNICKIISRVMIQLNIEYKTYRFVGFCSELNKIIKNSDSPKIYILDIELLNGSGLDLARNIRNIEYDSPIIFLSNHDDLRMEAYKNRLMIVDFISKFDNYEKNLEDCIRLSVNIIGKEKFLRYKYNGIKYNLRYSEILYICKDGSDKQSFIYTNNSKYIILSSLKSLKLELGSAFAQSHRSCLVNRNRIQQIDYKNGIIIFDNGKSIDLLSREYRSELDEYITVC